MKFPGGFNIQQMMKQAQVMQEKMQKEMEELRVEASAGGGVVTVEMKGNHELVALKIDPEAVKDGDVEMLQDMILAASTDEEDAALIRAVAERKAPGSPVRSTNNFMASSHESSVPSLTKGFMSLGVQRPVTCT